MRMGIFAKRNIAQGEELTFNYNVDRYGCVCCALLPVLLSAPCANRFYVRPRLARHSHDAQPCYCDEPNCVGSIGGKTQTDVAGMDDLFLDGQSPSRSLRPASPRPS